MTKRWKRRPEGSNWGDFGADDQRGRLNLLTPAKVREGLAEAREGIAFCLSLPLDIPGGNVLNPRRFPPQLTAGRRGSRRNYNYALSQDDPNWSDVICDDAVMLWTQYSTQWDALCHVGAEFDADDDGIAEKVYYNGFRADDEVVIAQRRPCGSGTAGGAGPGQAPGHREHGRDLRPGPCRDDRPARGLRAGTASGGL